MENESLWSSWKRTTVFDAAAKISAISTTISGSDFYWAIMSVMFTAMVGSFGWTFTVPRTARIFHYITILIVFVAGIAYFTMAANLGALAVIVEIMVTTGLVGAHDRTQYK